jgi:translation initiation factor 2B subunit (eIF-2B alpha/beta/delta family)
VADPWANLRAAAEDRVSGAAEIAERAAGALAALRADEVPEAAEMLLRGHPSVAPLWRLATRVMSASNPAAGAAGFLADLAFDGEAAAALASVLPGRVLTISYSSSVVAALRLRRPQRVACMRSDPGGEGERMLEALSGWTEAVLVSDQEALAAVPAEAVVVGADAVTPFAVVNKVKTAALARAARDHGVPSHVVAGGTKFVGQDIPVTSPFEAVPVDLFTGVATPAGILDPVAAAARARRFGIHALLRPLLDELRPPAG